VGVNLGMDKLKV